MSRSKRNRNIISGMTGAVVFSLASMAMASPITYVKVTNDADSGISSANSYTHAIDFEASGPGATINGVTFVSQSGSGGNFTHSVTPDFPLSLNNPGIVSTSGNLANLMQGFLFHNSQSTGTQTYTLSGLEAGTTYDLRLYTHAFSDGGTRLNTLLFDLGGAEVSTGEINEDDATSVGMPGANDSYYLNYRYTTAVDQTTLEFTATSSNGNASWHLYGLSNQVVPEPGAISLLGLGAGVLLALGRRRATT